MAHAVELMDLIDRFKKLKTQSWFMCTFVDDIMHDIGSLIIRAEARADEIARKIYISCPPKRIMKKRSSLTSKVEGWTREMSDLNPEIAKVFKSILWSSSPLKIHSPLLNLSLWIKFAESTVQNIYFVDIDAYYRLRMFTPFISRVNQAFPSGLMITGDHDRYQDTIEGFFIRVASAVYRATCLTCFGLFGAKENASEIKELIHEIFPTTPKSLDSFVKFLKAVQEISRGGLTAHLLAEIFRDSFLYQRSSVIPENLYRDLVDWLIFLINKAEGQPVNQDEECFLAEVKHVIVETIPDLNFGRYDKILSLERKHWLLQADLFLKTTIFELPEADQIDNLVNKWKERVRNYNQSADVVIFPNKIASDIKSLFQSFRDKEIEEYRVRSSIALLLSKIVLFRAKPALMDLLNRPGTVVSHCKDQLQALLEGLELFRSFVMDEHVENTFHEEKIFRSIEAVARRIITLPYLFLEKEIKEKTVKNAVADLLEEVKIVQAELGMFYSQIPWNIFPKQTAGMGFLDSLLENLLELLKRDIDLVPPVRDSMKKIQEDLVLLRSLLMKNSQKGNELLGSKDLGSTIAKMTYELDYVIDSIEVGLGSHWQHLLWLNHLQKEIDLIKMLVTRKVQENTSENGLYQISQISSHVLRAGIPENDKPMVSLSDQEEVIIDRLTRGSSQRRMVSIVGMPGLGKTTIARKVYENPRVAYHFHRRAWCFVSQSYVLRDLLINLLRDIQRFTDDIQDMDDADLELKLYRCLKKNRYLIVMDDVWDVAVWKDLQRSFPDDGNGSRILITTRLRKVALDSVPDSEPHSLRALSQDESWNLMEMRIFQKEGCCPEELVEVGKEIALHCKGLPLAVVAIAGILQKTEKKKNSWKRISQELNSWVIDDPETRCKDILRSSYNHLPAHLKACFLYFGAFQEDRDVPVRKLIQMWIAEGFIQKTEAKSLEEIGDEHLTDLVDRSLVMVSKRKSTGGVKACRIHDLLLDLCRSTAKEANFLELITRYREPYHSFHDLDGGVDFDRDDPWKLAQYDSHRVCIFLKRKHFVDSRPSGQCTRSLLFFASNDTYSRRPYNISFICQHFRLVRVLDLESINLGTSFPIRIGVLVHLRYVALSGDLSSIPESISNLWRLETLIVKGLSGKVELPDALWGMTSLRHVHVKNQAVFNLQGYKFGASFHLDNLVTFSSPSLSYGKDTEKVLKKLPKLVKFRCIFLESFDSWRNPNPFPRLDFLTQLESLNILYFGRACNPGELSLPVNIRKLTLSKFRLSKNHLSTIGKLPKLEVLKILSGSLEEPVWEMKDDEFQELKFLKLDSLDVAQWNAASDHLPKLRQLVLWSCKDLEELPYEFAEIPTLQIIEARGCSQSLTESIRNIEESTEGLQVLITR